MVNWGTDPCCFNPCAHKRWQSRALALPVPAPVTSTAKQLCPAEFCPQFVLIPMVMVCQGQQGTAQHVEHCSCAGRVPAAGPESQSPAAPGAVTQPPPAMQREWGRAALWNADPTEEGIPWGKLSRQQKLKEPSRDTKNFIIKSCAVLSVAPASSSEDY